MERVSSKSMAQVSTEIVYRAFDNVYPTMLVSNKKMFYLIVCHTPIDMATPV